MKTCYFGLSLRSSRINIVKLTSAKKQKPETEHSGCAHSLGKGSPEMHLSEHKSTKPDGQRNKNYKSKKIYRIDLKSLSHRYIVCSKVNHIVFHHLAANKEFPLTYTMSKCLIVDAPYLQMLLRGRKKHNCYSDFPGCRVSSITTAKHIKATDTM